MKPLLPRYRLSTRMALMFLLATLPAWLSTGAVIWVLNELVSQEIDARNRFARNALGRHLDAEQSRLQATLEGLADGFELRQLAMQIDSANVAKFEDIAVQLAASTGLEILAVAADAGPLRGHLVSSAHLRVAAEDPVPAFVTMATDAQVGLVYEAVDGNPITQVPALVAVRSIPNPTTGARALIIYGGIRLDRTRLLGLAEMTEAQLVLRAPGLREWNFGASVAAPIRSRLAIPFIPGGADHAPTPTDETAAVLEIRVDSPRLNEARKRVVRWAPLLVCGSLVLAIGLAYMLSRRVTHPIRKLSSAAQTVADGDLSVRVEPIGQDEVGHLMAVFNHMTGELADSREQLRRAERAAAWQQIARRVAHEIKNPLFPIQMSIETLQKSYDKKHPKLTEIVRESTKTVLEEVQALNRLVTEFSKFARLPPPNKQPIAVSVLYAHVLELYGADGRVSADFEGLSDLPMLNADREQMNRVLINLVKNALEAMGDGRGQVRLDARRGEAQSVLLTVADSGPGMTPSVQDEIFTPYFTTKPEGTGLGLAIVDRIVTEHGGEIQVHTSDRGTTFTVRMPTLDNPTASVRAALRARSSSRG